MLRRFRGPALQDEGPVEAKRRGDSEAAGAKVRDATGIKAGLV